MPQPANSRPTQPISRTCRHSASATSGQAQSVAVKSEPAQAVRRSSSWKLVPPSTFMPNMVVTSIAAPTVGRRYKIA